MLFMMKWLIAQTELIIVDHANLQFCGSRHLSQPYMRMYAGQIGLWDDISYLGKVSDVPTHVVRRNVDQLVGQLICVFTVRQKVHSF